MGREARCAATWGAHRGNVTALLESTELIVRGAFRARAPIASLRGVRAEGGTLYFRAGDDDVALAMGAAAPRWAAAIATPPPSLAAKLGIAGKRVLVDGSPTTTRSQRRSRPQRRPARMTPRSSSRASTTWTSSCALRANGGRCSTPVSRCG